MGLIVGGCSSFLAAGDSGCHSSNQLSGDWCGREMEVNKTYIITPNLQVRFLDTEYRVVCITMVDEVEVENVPRGALTVDSDAT